jgi:Flp pilus assembly protein TadG
MNRRQVTKPTPRNLKSPDGQTMVEFALVLPLLAMLLFGIIQFGIVFNNYLDLTDATRAGARKAAVSRNTSDPSGPAGVATQAVINSAGDLTLTSTNVTVQTTGSDGVNAWGAGDDVTVTASYPYKIDLFGFVFASGNLHSTTTERVE